MRVERRNVIDADRDAVWKIVSDPDSYPSFMARLERWESANDRPLGVGARYFVHWKVGSVPVGGLMEVVEFAGDGQTKVTFRLSYQAPGGIWGYIADRVAVGQVGRIAADTLKRLKRLAELGG
jgi:uncharacterized membrane protein